MADRSLMSAGSSDSCEKYDNPYEYTAIPMYYHFQLDCPTMIYAIYPSLTSYESLQPVLEYKKHSKTEDDLMQDIKSDCISEPIASETSDHCTASSSENVSKLSESINSSDYSMQNSSTENEENFGQVLDNSLEENTIQGDNNNFGFYGNDGCWYPSPISFDHSLISESTNEDQPNNSPFPDTNDESNQPSKLVMPKSLMSFYNYYQRLDLPSNALGRPHLIPSFYTNRSM